jgi:hypothetical protein
MHRTIAGDSDRPLKTLKLEFALAQLRGLVTSDVWSPTLGAVLAGQGDQLVEGAGAGDVLIQAHEELTQRRNAISAQVLS